MTRRTVWRYELPVDDQPHEFRLRPWNLPLVYATILPNLVEFWSEHDEKYGEESIWLQVYGTGHDIPEDAIHIGTCLRHSSGLVWHIFERRITS